MRLLALQDEAREAQLPPQERVQGGAALLGDAVPGAARAAAEPRA